MAAPKTAYSKQDIKATVSGTAHRLGRMPKALSEYDSDASMKMTFYLDNVLHTKDSGGTDCVIGCVSANTYNYNMHASKRIGHLRVTSGTTGDYILLTDGGLNTLGKGEVTTFYKGATNYVFYAYSNTAAYYLPHTFKLDYWTGSGAHTLVDNVSTVQSGVTSSGVKSTPVSIATTAATYNLRALATNTEGTFSGSTVTAPVRGACKMITVRKVSSISDNYTTGTSYNVLVFEDYYQTLASSTQSSGHYEYPNLKNLFATATSSTLTTNSLLNTGSTTNISNIVWNLHLPQGMFYGVPTTYNGSDYKIVYVNASGYPYKWATSTYSPTVTSYNIGIYGNFNFSSYISYNDSSTITLTGNGMIATDTFGTWFAASSWEIQNVPASKLNLTGEQVCYLTIDLTGWRAFGQDDVTLTLRDDNTGNETSVTSSGGFFSGSLSLDLGKLKNYAVADRIDVSIFITTSM